ncbi:DDE domain-containing protein [Mesorhizobium sp. NZP2077]|nr:DDE domain-containing protein [Mesorhizobium sp. NZP2077]QKD18970.1 DDE-type integrase/transposase/recombinase [Mesorhizobium sp. NZP2077]
MSCDAESRPRERSHRPSILVRKSHYLNNRIEQDHRRIKRRVRSTLGFKSMANTQITLSGIERST